MAILRETILTPRVKRLLEAVQTLESNHSSLVTAPNGDRYLRIAPFEKQGAKLKAGLRSHVRRICTSFPDDQGQRTHESAG
jgi:hypothetical protein